MPLALTPLALLLAACAGGPPLVVVGAVDGGALVMQVDGRRVEGALTPPGDQETPVSIKGSATKAGAIEASVGSARFEGQINGHRVEGTWTDSDGPRALTLGDGLDPVVLTRVSQTWLREWPDKPAGVEIPVELPRLVVADPALQARLDALLTPERLLGQSREEVEADGWVDAVTWSAGHAAQGLVCLNVHVEGSGAYPSGFTRSLVVHVPEARLQGAEAFDPARHDALAALVDARLQALLDEVEDPALVEELRERRFTAEGLAAYALAPEGLVFHHAWGLPHAVAALSPPDAVLVGWDELRPFLAEGSPLKALAGP